MELTDHIFLACRQGQEKTHAEHDVVERIEVALFAVRPGEGGVPGLQARDQWVVYNVRQLVPGACTIDIPVLAESRQLAGQAVWQPDGSPVG